MDMISADTSMVWPDPAECYIRAEIIFSDGAELALFARNTGFDRDSVTGP
jgi:hypothetical protein